MNGDRLINRKERKSIDSLSDVTVWRLERLGLYPSRRQISPGRIGWVLSEVLEFVGNRKKANKGQAA